MAELNVSASYRIWFTPDDTDYADLNALASAPFGTTNSSVYIGQRNYNPGVSTYTICRFAVCFNTSSIPAGATITNVVLRIKVLAASPTIPFDLIIQNGQPTYPHHPAEQADFYRGNYSGNGGSINTDDMVIGSNDIDLNVDWVTKEGETKLMLRGSNEINAVAPLTDAYDWIWVSAKTTRPRLIITYEEVVAEITTQAATEIIWQAAMGNGTIVAGEPTERGFEIRLDFGENKDSNSGTLANYIDHSIAGFEGDVTWDIVYKWNGVLTKTESETGTFEPEAYELVLGYPSVLGNPSSVFNDKLFKCESYTYRAYMVIGETTYTGDWVAFDTLCADAPADDDIIDIDDPIIPPDIPDIPDIPDWYWDIPDWDKPDWDIPPWEWDIPDWDKPDYPPMSWTGDFYYRKPYTKKDLDDLRKKCIIYNKNSIEFAMVLRHNMNVLRGFFNMMTDYMDKEEFNDFTDLIPPQRLKELYLDPLGLNDFRDMINGFIRNTIDNNIAVNRNFNLIQDGLSDYETESDDAYFKEINSNIKTVTEDDPDVHRLKRKIDSLNQEVSMNFSSIMYNLKVLRARLL